MVTIKASVLCWFSTFLVHLLVDRDGKLCGTLSATHGAHGEALHNSFSGQHGTEVPFIWFSDTIALLLCKAVPVLSALVGEAVPFL